VDSTTNDVEPHDNASLVMFAEAFVVGDGFA
jgi:hypothetical protein